MVNVKSIERKQRMVQITEELANELIDWLDVDLDNTVTDDDADECQEMIDELNDAINEIQTKKKIEEKDLLFIVKNSFEEF